MNECEKYREMISAMLDGELDAAGSEQLVAHLSLCAECRELYELLSSVSGPEVWALPEVPEGLHGHIMSGVKSAASARKKEGFMRKFRPVALAAACLVVIVGVIFGVPRVFRMGGSDSGSPEAVFNTSASAASNSAPAAQDNAGTDTTAAGAPADSAGPSQDAPDADSVFDYVSSFTGQSGATEGAPVPEPEAAPEELEEAEVPVLEIDIDSSVVTVEAKGKTVSEELNRDDTLIWLRAVIEGNFGGNFDAAKVEISRREGADYEVYIYNEGKKLMGSLSVDLESSIELETLADFAKFEEMADDAK